MFRSLVKTIFHPKIWTKENFDSEAIDIFFVVVLVLFSIYSLHILYFLYPKIEAIVTVKCNFEEEPPSQDFVKVSKDRVQSPRCFKSKEQQKYLENFLMKQKHIRFIGVVILVWDMALLIFKHSLLTNKMGFYLGYTELIFWCDFLCISVVKNANISIVAMFLAILGLSVLNPQMMNDENSIDNITTVLNALLGSWFILKYWEYEANENFEGKKLLEEKEDNLKEILNLFPSAILFYNQKDGIIYKNKYFNEIIEDVILRLEKKMNKATNHSIKKVNNIQKTLQVFKNSIDIKNPNKGDEDRLLSEFMNKDEHIMNLAKDLKTLCQNR
jgi:hypothetical protein